MVTIRGDEVFFNGEKVADLVPGLRTSAKQEFRDLLPHLGDEPDEPDFDWLGEEQV